MNKSIWRGAYQLQGHQIMMRAQQIRHLTQRSWRMNSHARGDVIVQISLLLPVLLPLPWSINSRASQTDHMKNLNCPEIRESIRKCLSKSRRKRSTIRQAPLIQPRCSLASINREAFEVLGMWGSKENSSRKQIHAYAQRIFQEKCPIDVAKDEKKQKQKQKITKEVRA